MLSQPYNSDFILSMIKEVEAHESRGHWTLTKKSEVKNKHKNKDGKLKPLLSYWFFKRNIFSYVRLIKNKSRLFAHGEIQEWVVNYL